MKKRFKEWLDGEGAFIIVCVFAFGLSLLIAKILIGVWYA